MTAPRGYRAWALGAVVVVGVVGAPPAVAQDAESSPRITDLRVEGLRRVEEAAALAGVQSKRDAALDPALVSQDVRAVWNTGFFRDVRAEVEDADGGVMLVFVVEEKPSVREVRYEGHDDVSEEDIKGVVDVKPFTILNIELLRRNVEKIKELYVGKGFYLAEIDYRIEPVKDSPHEVDVVFAVVENAKVVVREISFVGNRQISDDELKAVLQTREGNELSWLTQSGTYKEEFFQTDVFRIQAYYYDHGFVSVDVGDPSVVISPDRRYIYISVPIEEGLKYDLGEITFSGNVLLKSAEGQTLVDEPMLRQKLTIRPGDTFNRSKLFENIQQLTDVYRDQGYAYANVVPNHQIHQEERRVDLDLQVELGELVYFERIEMVGNTRTRDKVIRREMRIVEGEKYSATGLNRSRARVFQLGFFETVNITTNRGSRPDLMNVTVEVKEKSTGTFQIGAGFSSVESFIATAQISQQNFLGNGQLLSLSAQLSFGDFARQLATLQFYDPYFLDTIWSLGLNGFITQRFYRDFQRNSTGLSPSFGYPITHDIGFNVGYTLESIAISTDLVASGGGAALANLNRDGINSAVSGSLSYDTRDNRLFPSSGQYHVLSAELSDPAIFSDEDLSYRRLQLFLRYFHPLPLSLVLRLNARFGYIFGGGEDGVPISERFLTGGIFDVRGFEPRGLGPTVDVLSVGDPFSRTTKFTIGGNKEAIFNLEVEFPIIEAAGIKGVVFTDAGNAYNDDQGFFYIDTPARNRPTAFMLNSGREVTPPFGLYYSFGFGFRWFSPIGPLRFEWGIPITKRAREDRNLIFEFTIGNFF